MPDGYILEKNYITVNRKIYTYTYYILLFNVFFQISTLCLFPFSIFNSGSTNILNPVYNRHQRFDKSCARQNKEVKPGQEQTNICLRHMKGMKRRSVAPRKQASEDIPDLASP